MAQHLDWNDDETTGFGATLDRFQEQDELETGQRVAEGFRKEWVDGVEWDD